MPDRDNRRENEESTDSSEAKSGDVRRYVVLSDGTTSQVTVGTNRDASSYDEIVEQIATADGMPRVMEVVLRNMAAFDRGWWSYLHGLISDFSQEGQKEFARQGINTGKFICDQVLVYGTDEQLATASEWRNRYLIAEVTEHLRNMGREDEIEDTMRAVLQTDVDAITACLILGAILSKANKASGYASLLASMEANANWLDQHSFEGLSHAIQEAERQGKQELAWRSFIAGAIAGSTLLNHNVTQLRYAEAFMDRFPEQRYR